MRIAVYSGSFDPLHIGHLAILKHLTECGGFDGTYLIVSPQNPLKDKSKAHNAQERFEAAKDAVARHPEIKATVDGIEMSMPAPHYTILTLEALSRREPDNEFTFVMGADSLSNICHWREYRRILSEFGVAVYPREGYDLTAICSSLLEESQDYRIEIIDAPMVNVSSTQIRDAISRGEDVSSLMM